MLSHRAANLADLAAVACLRMELFTTLDRSDRSIEVALDYLRRVGVAWSAHPTQEEVRHEYERIWQQIRGRPIEELLDLPRMADPVWSATMDVLTAVVSPALFTDQNLYRVVIGRMANLSLEHGNSDASSYAYAILGTVLGGQFGDYKAAFRFGQLGFNLAAKRGLDRFKARIYLIFGHHVMPWSKPIRTGRSLIRRAFDAAQEAGRSHLSGPLPAPIWSRICSPAAIRSTRCSGTPRPGSTSRARRGSVSSSTGSPGSSS